MSEVILNPFPFAPLWTPADDGADLQLWLDAADEDTITESAGLVSQWDDKSGNARNATQGTAANQPTTGTQVQNGLNVLDFITNDFFSVDLNFLGGASHTAFVVCERDGNGSNIYGAATGNQGAASIHVGYRDNAANTYRMNYWANDYYPAVPSGAQSGYNAIMWKWTYNSRKDIRSNGGGDLGNAQAGSPTTPAGGGRIASVVGQAIFDGRIAEILIFNVAIANVLRDKVEGYLAWKWGLQAKLASAHQYKSNPPREY